MPTGITITEKELEELRECLEILRAVESLEFHNKNWLSRWVVHDTCKASEEKQHLIERALAVIGTSAGNPMS